MLRTASAHVQFAILHCIPARLRPPGIPFRMTVLYFWAPHRLPLRVLCASAVKNPHKPLRTPPFIRLTLRNDVSRLAKSTRPPDASPMIPQPHPHGRASA